MCRHDLSPPVLILGQMSDLLLSMSAEEHVDNYTRTGGKEKLQHSSIEYARCFLVQPDPFSSDLIVVGIKIKLAAALHESVWAIVEEQPSPSETFRDFSPSLRSSHMSSHPYTSPVHLSHDFINHKSH